LPIQSGQIRVGGDLSGHDFIRVHGLHRSAAVTISAVGGRSGAVVLSQRFGGALNLNLHFHALVIDGVYSSKSPLAPPIFHEAPPLTDQDVVLVTTILHRRILRCLRRLGRIPRDEHDDLAEPELDEPLFAELCAASVPGRVALGPKSGAAVERLGRRGRAERPLFVPGDLCRDIERFSLHAKVLIAATHGEGREGLERLCRYIARPPIKVERLSLDANGRVIYALRRHWRDGTSAIAFDPLDFLSRLAALVPRPRVHLLTYHGILAPAAEWRDLVVPSAGARSSPKHAPVSGPALTPKVLRPTRTSWAELMKRVFAIDVLVCPHCDGTRKLIALLTDGVVVRKILAHLGLSTEPPPLAPVRTPPEPEFAW
jgi:hypothetical protein